MEFYFEIPADQKATGYKDLWPLLAEKYDVPVRHICETTCTYDDNRGAYVGTVRIWHPVVEFNLEGRYA
jgi:hypothetical protein